MHREIIRIARFVYPIPGRRAGVCQLTIMLAPLDSSETSIVIATELDDNPGMSITNAAEELIAAIGQQLSLSRTLTAFIEHYPAGGGRSIETFDQVIMNPLTLGVTWKRLDNAMMEFLQHVGMIPI